MLKQQSAWSSTAEHDYKSILQTLSVHLIYGNHDWSHDASRKWNVEFIQSLSEVVIMDDTGHSSF